MDLDKVLYLGENSRTNARFISSSEEREVSLSIYNNREKRRKDQSKERRKKKERKRRVDAYLAQKRGKSVSAELGGARGVTN
jgi:predicted RNA-binding protein with RPS1 domain